jgi:hypothetical protein
MEWYGLLAVLDALAQGDTVPSTAQQIVTAAECYSACIPRGLLPYALIVAVQNLTTGSGGLGGVTCSNADPVAAPTSACTLHYRKDTGTLWMWNGAAWVNLIA